MATKTMKPDKEAITEILVADTDSESSAEDRDVEEEQQQQEQLIQQASAQDKPQAATSGRWLPPWGQPQGRNTNVQPFVVPAKGVKKMRLHTLTKTVHHCLCWCCFLQKFFICWCNRPNYIRSNSQTVKPDLAADYLTLRYQTWWLSLP